MINVIYHYIALKLWSVVRKVWDRKVTNNKMCALLQ